MSEMIERVARAICGRKCLRAEALSLACPEPGPCLATRDQLVLSWRWDRAKAAITAMREPTEAMVENGAQVWYDTYTAGLSGPYSAMPGHVKNEYRDVARSIIIAAIDAALR